MKNRGIYLYIFLFLVLLGVTIRQIFLPVVGPPYSVVGTSTDQANTTSTDPLFNEELEQLVEAYPEFLLVDPNLSNEVIWKQDGARMRFDDWVLDKDFDKMLNEPDLQDQMIMQYEPGDNFTIRKDHDPGRIRFEPFFMKMYGATEEEVQANLETIYWLPSSSNQPLLVTAGSA